MSELFRPQAVDHQRHRLDGQVVLAAPLPTMLLGGLLIVAVALAVAFASLATYSRKEEVPGWIVPDAGLIRVTARQAGVVEALQASEGREVRAGQAVATLRLSSDVAGGDAGQSLIRQLTAEGDADQAQGRAARAKIDDQAAELASRRGLLVGELAEARGRIAVLEEKQKLAQAQVDRGTSLLQRGFLSPAAMDSLKSAVLAAAQDASEARSAALDLRRQIDDLDHERAGLAADLASVDAQARQSQASLRQRQVEAESQSNLVATSPIDGRIVAVPVVLGQAVTNGATMAVVTPTGSRLSAELYAPSRAAGFIRAGQEVRLQYQAFPYQTFGTGRGVVTSVSSTVLAPSEIAIPGLVVREPVFRLRVALARPDVEAYGRATPLQPGMLLTAEVVIDHRSLLQWILDPLYAVGRRT
jgi:membrane fusion protein